MPDVAMTDRPPPAPPSESPLQERLRILRESTGSATLTPNAETYVKRAAELVHNEEGPVGQRHTIAGCALRCALQECEAAMRTGGGASAKDSIRLLRFAEELRQAIRECDEAASYAGVVDTPTVDVDEADDRPVRGCGAFWDFSEFCGRDSASLIMRRRNRGVSSPSDEVVGGRFFDFEPFRTASWRVG